MKTRTTTLGELKSMMANGEAKFAYVKKDGTTRVARGTNNLSLVPSDKKPGDGKNYAKDAGYCIYFDLDKMGYRCFSEKQLLGIIVEN